jgi:SAM-dependent methyltransferase
MTAATFKDLEHAGWSSRAAGYDVHFAPVTQQAIGPLIDAAAADWRGLRVLDICAGTGHAAGLAAARGATAEGVDFAQPMVEVARRNYPAVTFRQGDAERLPYPDAGFDVAVCAFGLLHLADADAALREAFRILRPGGRFAYATWTPPGKGFDLQRLVGRAIERHGRMDAPLPPAPPTFRFADPAEAERALEAAGFAAVACADGVALWRGADGAAVIDLIYKGVVRTPMLIDHQEPKVRGRILAAIAADAEAYRKNGAIELRWPYVIATAVKPA